MCRYAQRAALFRENGVAQFVHQPAPAVDIALKRALFKGLHEGAFEFQFRHAAILERHCLQDAQGEYDLRLYIHGIAIHFRLENQCLPRLRAVRLFGHHDIDRFGAPFAHDKSGYAQLACATRHDLELQLFVVRDPAVDIARLAAGGLAQDFEVVLQQLQAYIAQLGIIIEAYRKAQAFTQRHTIAVHAG